jgi:hypothetical protein
MDLQTSGASVFRVDPNGAITVGTTTNSSAAAELSFRSASPTIDSIFVPGSLRTTGSVLNVSDITKGTIATSFTGSLINIHPVRWITGGTGPTDAGRFLNLSRSNLISVSGQTFTMSGDVATMSSNCSPWVPSGMWLEFARRDLRAW